jgi:purine-binding chemotaxis protein CheW
MTSSASESEAAIDGHSGGQYLTFFIAGEEYAVRLDRVREVIPYDTVTRVPGMPAPVRGVTNLRGGVIPVIDLAIKFRLPAIPVSTRTCIVLVDIPLEGTPTVMGLMTEEVGQVLSLSADQLLPAPAFGAPIRTDFLKGVAQVGKKFALILDIERVLSPHELLEFSAVPDTSAADVAHVADELSSTIQELP